MATELVKGIPILASLNLDETVTFYEDKLGFKMLAKMDDYVICRRDDLELHFWLCEERHIAESTACYVHVRGIEALYKEYKAQDVIPPNGDLEMKPWGAYQFAVHDSHGNQITFAEVS